MLEIKLNKEDWKEILENSVSWIVVMGMLIYGLGKYMQFEGAAEIDKSVKDLTGMELMWAFYGYSKHFALTIGFFEVLGGVLILIKKTRLIGCLITTVILTNIIFQDIFYDVLYGALIAAIIYQICVLIILWLNKKKVFESIKELLIENNIGENNKKIVAKIIISIFIFLVLRVFEFIVTIKI